MTDTIDMAAAFPTGSAETAALIRNFDWSLTALGPIAGWPSSLRTMTAMLLQSPLPMALLWGGEGTLIYNDGYAVIAGARHPAALGARAIDVWPEAASFNQTVLDTVLAGKALSYKDLELTLDRNGRPEPVWLNLDYSPVFDESGRPAGAIAVVMETTARVVADRRAASEQARQQRMFQQMPGFIGLLSGPDHIYEYVNEAYVAIAGPRDYIGRPLRDVFPEVAGQGFFELLDRVFATGEPYLAYGVPVHLDKEVGPRFLDLLFEPIRDADAGVTGIFIGGYDVTKAYQTTEALRRSEERYRTLFESTQQLNETLEQRVEQRTKELQDSKDFARLALSAVGGVGVWTFDVASDRFFCDAAVSELYGLDPVRGAAGLPRTEFLANVHPGDLAALSVTMSGGLVRAGDLELEYRIVHADGSIRWVLSKGHTYFDAAGKPVRRTGVGVDMTNKRILEEQFRQAQKMEAVGQLTGGIAHDFNNLLAGIGGSLELLERRIAAGRHDGIDRYISGAQASTRRAAALTQRLLAFSRRQTLDPKPTDADQLVAGMEELIRRTVGPAISVEIGKGEDLWLIHVDPSQLENALLNLSINARDAMPDGGVITIRTANRVLDPKLAKTLSLPAGDYVTVVVTDTGTGMPEDVIRRVFDPFFTTKPLGQGTGLGLSMIHGFVMQSGGQVDIASTIGAGTTMTILLPRFVGTLIEAAVSEDALLEATGGGRTILVIDDEQLVRAFMVELLEEAGYRVIEAQDGPSGLKILNSGERIDLLITDVGLPGGYNGRQVADAARATRPALKVLFVTGYAESVVVSNDNLADGMHVITKPFDMQSFARRVGELVAG